MRVCNLPCFGIVVEHDDQGGKITSELHEKGEGRALKAAIDTLEAFILACAVAGINIESPAFLEAVETTVDGITNNLG